MDIDDSELETRSEFTTSSALTGTTAPSIYSYSSSRDGEALLREYMGRVFNAKNELYLLPAGEFSYRCPIFSSPVVRYLLFVFR